MQRWDRTTMRKAIEEQHRREAVAALLEARPHIVGSQAENRLGYEVIVEDFSSETAMVRVRRVGVPGPSHWVSPDKLANWR